MQREVRATRGKRFSELVGEEADKDKAFWEHSTWEEDDSGNESYEEKEEDVKPDVFDSDFNETEDDESSEDEEAQLRKTSKRSAPSTKNTYKEPIAKKRPATTSSDQPRVPKPPRPQGDTENVLAVKLRQSTTKKTLQHEQARIASQRIKVVQRPPLPKREFSQRDLLFEALDTEVWLFILFNSNILQLNNAKWLRGQQMAEEEKINLDKPSKTPLVNKITILSRRGQYNTITFPESKWPTVFELSLRDAPKKVTHTRFCRFCLIPSISDSYLPEQTCVITGLAGRYLDPVTGYPYHNLEAYKELKEKYHHRQN
jgi:vacuolar protein sorting-associated protein 72